MEWMDAFARDGTPMELDKYLTYTALDIVGEVVFSKPFGFVSFLGEREQAEQAFRPPLTSWA